MSARTNNPSYRYTTDRSITAPGLKSRAGQKDSVTDVAMVQGVLMTMILTTGQSENLYSLSLFKNTEVGWVKDGLKTL